MLKRQYKNIIKKYNFVIDIDIILIYNDVIKNDNKVNSNSNKVRRI